jgi:hypothetical protein
MAAAGIEWVNQYHGRASNLSNNDNNAQGFYNKLSAVRQFEYGDDMAWDSDFEASGAGIPPSGSDTIFADAVDIVFFSGHGSSSGMFFGNASHDDGTAGSGEMRLGNSNLEWIAMDACEVLAWDSGKVWNRWGWPVFRGLHLMLGFHTTCTDVKDRGEKFADRLNNGWTVRDAWIRACIETEGSDVSWAYLRADAAGTDTFNDHWWGKGTTSADPSTPTSLFYLNGQC